MYFFYPLVNPANPDTNASHRDSHGPRICHRRRHHYAFRIVERERRFDGFFWKVRKIPPIAHKTCSTTMTKQGLWTCSCFFVASCSSPLLPPKEPSKPHAEFHYSPLLSTWRQFHPSAPIGNSLILWALWTMLEGSIVALNLYRDHILCSSINSKVSGFAVGRKHRKRWGIDTLCWQNARKTPKLRSGISKTKR